MFSLEKIVRKNILDLNPYSSARDDYKDKEGIFLDANENPLGELNRYPDPYQLQLKEKISLLKGVNPQNIFLGNGSDEAIDLVCRIFCDPGKSSVLTFTPTYGMYEVSAAINGIELLTLPLDNQFQLNETEVLQALSNKSLNVIFVCSPNNPTGNCIDGITFLLENFEGIIVVDEAYADFSSTPSWLSSIQRYPNLIVLQTFSKAWGLAAVRVGTAFANEDIIKLFNKVKPPYNISFLNQQAVLAALSDVNKYHLGLKAIITARASLLEELQSISFIKEVYPTEANFVLIKLDEAKDCYDYLVSQKIIVRNRSTIINNCLRITVGTQSENNTLLTALKKYADEKSTIYR